MTRRLLETLDPEAAALLPKDASSAVLAALCWSAEAAARFSIPPGFGFLVPQIQQAALQTAQSIAPQQPQLLACTFVDQKFPHRAPPGARILRVFFGGGGAEALTDQPDDAAAQAALAQLQTILQSQEVLHTSPAVPLPPPDAALTVVRRWPRSRPQYEVGHLDRMTALDRRVGALGRLTLLGSAYRGVGLPDLIQAARQAARQLVRSPTQAPR